MELGNLEGAGADRYLYIPVLYYSCLLKSIAFKV